MNRKEQDRTNCCQRAALRAFLMAEMTLRWTERGLPEESILDGSPWLGSPALGAVMLSESGRRQKTGARI